MTDSVILGAMYTHPDKPGLWKVEAASVPELDDRVFLIRPDMFTKQGFIEGWRGSWAEFLEQWERA